MQQAFAVENQSAHSVVFDHLQYRPTPHDRFVTFHGHLVYPRLHVGDYSLLVVEGQTEVDPARPVDPIPVDEDLRWELFDRFVIADECGVDPGGHA